MMIAGLTDRLRSRIEEEGHLSGDRVRARLLKLKEVIASKEEQIAGALRKDLGKSAFEAYMTETGFILDELGHTIRNLDKWSAPKKVGSSLTVFPAKGVIYPEPYGVVLIISPWNYPFQLCMSPLIGAIAARNRVVLKPSELSPHTSKIVSEIVREVFSDDEVSVVEGGVEETQTLLRERFDYIFFTGSTQVGKVIMKAAAEHLTPVTLELGGKSPLVIEESADLDLAAKRCVWGKFLNAGQTCVAPDYVLVPARLQNEFIEGLKKYLRTFYGENIRASEDYPRIINTRHFDRLKSLILEEKVVIGNEENREERYLSPTVMRDVSWNDKIMEDEIFGPVLPVIPYENLDEELRRITSRPKPLAFYLFTRNVEKKKRILETVSFGGGCINDTVLHLANPNLPFGGVGASGMGSYHGRKTFETFSHFKSVLEQKYKVEVPLRYPPYKGKLGWLKLFL